MKCCDLIQDIIEPLEVSIQTDHDDDDNADGDDEDTGDTNPTLWLSELVDCASSIFSSDSPPPVLVLYAATFMKVVIKRLAQEILGGKRSIFRLRE